MNFIGSALFSLPGYNGQMRLNPEKLRFLIVGLTDARDDRQETEDFWAETEGLVRTYGGKIIEVLQQNSIRADSGTYIGRGKTLEIANRLTRETIDVVLINDAIKSGQLFALRKIFQESNPKVKVWDWVDLIFEIFRKHATTSEAKMQIELAKVKHMGPEVHGIGTTMSQQGGGIGTRGMGETVSEVAKRKWRAEIKTIEEELEKVMTAREQQMAKRKKSGVPTVSIVGYTNAGKSTLFNALTKKDTLVMNAPFATLDSAVGSLYLPTLKKEVFISDTIGFIQKLPPDLMASFSSTLMETVNADLLLHVVDASDPLMMTKIETVESVLEELGAGNKKRLYVLNKIDKPSVLNEQMIMEINTRFDPLFLSLTEGEGVDELIEAVEAELAKAVISA